VFLVPGCFRLSRATQEPLHYRLPQPWLCLDGRRGAFTLSNNFGDQWEAFFDNQRGISITPSQTGQTALRLDRNPAAAYAQMAQHEMQPSGLYASDSRTNFSLAPDVSFRSEAEVPDSRALRLGRE
jgi:hypothetical protein